ncbi:MAG: hypothetical protein ACFFBJ_09330 [Promethearchaeota archaeon]
MNLSNGVESEFLTWKQEKLVLLRSKRKKHTIEEISIDELLDDLTNTDPRPESRPAEDPWSEEYLTKLHKREARKTLDKYRRDEPIVSEQPKPREESPVVSEKMSQIRKCQSCYYCTGTRKVGGSWWCHCTNPGRSTECELQTQSWVKSKLNLPCWKLPD